MKTNFDPQDFQAALSGLSHIVQTLVRSQTYQELCNSKYAQTLDFTLVDALQGIQQTEQSFTEYQTSKGVELDF